MMIMLAAWPHGGFRLFTFHRGTQNKSTHGCVCVCVLHRSIKKNNKSNSFTDQFQIDY